MEEIFHRVSVRKYQKKKVESEKQEQLLRAAMSAPSAGNQQPWEFLLIENQETLEALSHISPYAGCAASAPMAIVALADQKYCRFPENWQMDMSAAVENILLEAVNLGLGAVWLGVAPLEDRMAAVSRLFHLPDGLLAFAVIPCGYPEVQATQKDRFNRDRIHYEQW